LPVTVTETAAPGPYEWNDDPEGTEDTGDKDPELISKPPISLNQEQQMSLLRRLNRLREDIEANINNLSGEIIEALLEDIFTLEDEIITGTIKVGDGKKPDRGSAKRGPDRCGQPRRRGTTSAVIGRKRTAAPNPAGFKTGGDINREKRGRPGRPFG
jgi:hypothetical protein